jgi:hypothetical protein
MEAYFYDFVVLEERNRAVGRWHLTNLKTDSIRLQTSVA